MSSPCVGALSDSGAVTGALLPLQLAEGLSACIEGSDRRIEELAGKKYGHTKLLRHGKGVGPVTALAYVWTLEISNDSLRVAR